MASFDIPEYTNEDFKNLLYPIYEVPEGKSIMSAIGEKHLNHPEFKVVLGPDGFGLGDKDRVIRYIACVYDKDSPFVNDYEDVNIRKILSAAYVGFKSDEYHRFDKHVEVMMLGGIEKIVDMIIRYCRGYNQPDYSFLMAIWDDFYRTLKAIQSGEEYDYAKVTKMRNDIKELSKTFLQNDDSNQLITKLYKDIEEDSLLLRPEDVAQKLADGVSPVTSEEISEYESEHITSVQSTGDGADS